MNAYILQYKYIAWISTIAMTSTYYGYNYVYAGSKCVLLRSLLCAVVRHFGEIHSEEISKKSFKNDCIATT